MRYREARFTSLIALVLLAACGPAPASRPQSDTTTIAPLAAASLQGTLVVGVVGAPRGIEYTINGVRIQPEAPIRWWEDARLSLPLTAGMYEVEATYSVRAFAGGKDRARLETAAPVPVEPGGTTYLLAEIQRDWRGVPQQNPAVFRLVDANEFHARTRPATPALPAAAAATSGADEMVVPEAAAAAPPPDIVIRGDEVLPAGEAGLPPVVIPAPEDLPEPAAPVTIAVQLRSEPDGARVFLDDRDMGSTPLRLQLDPATDHVLRFERDGCGDHVRFLAAASWREGRSSTITVQLECP